MTSVQWHIGTSQEALKKATVDVQFLSVPFYITTSYCRQ